MSGLHVWSMSGLWSRCGLWPFLVSFLWNLLSSFARHLLLPRGKKWHPAPLVFFLAQHFSSSMDPTASDPYGGFLDDDLGLEPLEGKVGITTFAGPAGVVYETVWLAAVIAPPPATGGARWLTSPMMVLRQALAPCFQEPLHLGTDCG